MQTLQEKVLQRKVGNVQNKAKQIQTMQPTASPVPQTMPVAQAPQQPIQTTPQQPTADLQTFQRPTQPSMQDYLNEAEKISKMRMKAGQDQVALQTKDVADQFARSLYSRNVGAQSGVGQELTRRAIGEQMEQYAPMAAMEQAGLAEKQLQYSREQEQNQQALQNNRLQQVFDMAVSGKIQGPALNAVLSEFNLTPEQVDIPTLKEETIQAYIDSKIAADQPINVDELNSLLNVTGLEEGQLSKEQFIYSPSFAQSILSTEDADLMRYLKGKGFDRDTKFKIDTPFLKMDDYWVMKKSQKNMNLFKKLYETDKEFRAYVDGFL